MKTRFSKQVRFLWVLGLALGAVGPRAFAQTAAELGIQLYAGLNITGTVGLAYSIEYVSDPAQTNTASAWRCLEFLQLPASPYLWIDKSAPATGRRFYRAVGFTVPTNMVFIPSGAFLMGSPSYEQDHASDEGPHTVTLTQGFWMGKYEVTQREYQALMGNNPSLFKGDLDRPVEMVTWLDVTNYCAKLTTQELSAGRMPSGSVYRLPTEAEWEYACRAGTTTATAFGNSLRSTQANFDGNYPYNGAAKGPYLERTTKVGSYAPNAWGLYDMHGNVWEWCLDRYGPYPRGSVTDPKGPSVGSGRVLRGGSWNYWGTYCRSAWRHNDTPGDRILSSGFRVVLAPGQP